MKRLLVTMLAVVGSVAHAQTLPRSLTHVPDNVTAGFDYTATTDAPVRRSGQVTARGLIWTCSGTTCTIHGNWERPGIPACAALAQQVGHIVSYGRPGVMLGPVQLRLCNAPISNAGASPSTPPAATGVVITTPGLRAEGGSPIAASTVAPVVITTPALRAEGGAPISPAPSGPITITTPTLRAEGVTP